MAIDNNIKDTGNANLLTTVGKIIRALSLDEIPQLINIIKGDMSLIGPRPWVPEYYQNMTTHQRRRVSVRPGITDFASIVFSDEGAILTGHPDPDAGYDQLIRPGKSLLGLFYVEHQSTSVDIWLVWLTLITIVSRQRALRGVQMLLRRMGASADLVHLASREDPLVLMSPPR
jgi:lipopolysaccharide/colanic/teichoic acid biosynthesis glycosyltransferase